MKTLDVIDQSTDKVFRELTNDSDLFEKVLDFSLSNHERAWKAGWLINQQLKKDNTKIISDCHRICNSIKGKPANQRRELLKLLESCVLNEENEGEIFDVAVYCWEQVGAQPSSRMVAFRLMISVAKRHSELISEIEVLTEERFMQDLSSGIKRSVMRRISELGK